MWLTGRLIPDHKTIGDFRKPIISGIEAKGRFGKQDFVYLSDEDMYRCPAGEKLAYHYQ
jgi:hypothetical protein